MSRLLETIARYGSLNIAIASLCAVSAIVLLEIDTIIPRIDLSVLRADGNAYVSITFLLTLCYMAILGVWKYLPKARIALNETKRKITKTRRVYDFLDEVNNSEKRTIALFIYGNYKSIPLRNTIASAQSLFKKEIIELDSISGAFDRQPFYRITKSAKRYIHKHQSEFFTSVAQNNPTEFQEEVGRFVEKLIQNQHK